MGRFDVYAMRGQSEARYVLDVQADLLQDLTTRVAPKQARGLNPAFEVNGQPHLMLTHSSPPSRPKS